MKLRDKISIALFIVVIVVGSLSVLLRNIIFPNNELFHRELLFCGFIIMFSCTLGIVIAGFSCRRKACIKGIFLSIAWIYSMLILENLNFELLRMQSKLLQYGISMLCIINACIIPEIFSDIPKVNKGNNEKTDDLSE